MLGKLQKILDSELHDAQEDENNAADPILFNSVRGTLWYLVPGFVKPHTEECRARIIQAMTEDVSLDDDIIIWMSFACWCDLRKATSGTIY